MREKRIFKNSAVIIMVLVVITSLFVLGLADGAEPGSEADPIVTLSFVEKKIEQLKYYIDSNLNASLGDIDELIVELEKKDNEIKELKKMVESALTFEVVELKNGQVLLAKEGAEIVVRAGESSAVYGQNGGLSDITSAKDLKSGEKITLNHMLIASRDDGRGLKANSQVFLIIKGGYTLK